MTQTHLHHSSRKKPTPAFTRHLMARSGRSSLGKSSATASTGGGAPTFPLSSEDMSASRDIARDNAVVVVSRKGCCMSHVATRLLCSLGVNPRVVEIAGAHPEQQQQQQQRLLLADGAEERLRADGAEEEEVMPAIFIGGRLLGGVDRLLAAHISGSLVPQLKEAGALWL